MSASILEVHPPVDVFRHRDYDFQLEVYQSDEETPQGVTSADVFRFKVWQTADLAPTIDIDSIALSSATFTADAGTDFCTSNAHGLSNGDRVRLTTSGTIPAGLALLTVYSVVNKTTNTFQLSATSGGSAIDITTAGSGTHTWARVYSTITVNTVGLTDTTPAKITVKLYAVEIDLLAAGTWYWEAAVVVNAEDNRIKPFARGTLEIQANATGDAGVT